MAKAEWQETSRLIDLATAILEEQSPMTIRQLFYRLVSIKAIENSRHAFQKVSRLMTKARKDGRCPYDSIVDREYDSGSGDRRNPVQHSQTKNYFLSRRP